LEITASGYGPKMTNRKSRLTAALFAFVLMFLGGTGVAQATPFYQDAASIQQNACGDLAGFSRVALSSLPAQASTTYDLIQTDGPFPYPKNDGVVFENREDILPDCATGYYHEYTVPTPGSSDRGARRIVTGDAGEYFYTGDHYASFKVVSV
jgi:guanyl-specific ribonuclease Sa